MNFEKNLFDNLLKEVRENKIKMRPEEFKIWLKSKIRLFEDLVNIFKTIDNM